MKPVVRRTADSFFADDDVVRKVGRVILSEKLCLTNLDEGFGGELSDIAKPRKAFHQNGIVEVWLEELIDVGGFQGSAQP